MSELSKNKAKWIRSLQLKKFRDQENVYLLEGEKMITEAIQEVPDLISIIYHTKAFQLPVSSQMETVLITDDQLHQISSLNSPNKALAILKKPLTQTPGVVDDMTLALDGLQDPGNLGTILRIADWFGIKQIVCSNETVDCYNTKVIQSSMGSIFRVKISYCNLSEWLKNQHLPIYKATMSGSDIYTETKLLPGILVLGNEGKGISEKVNIITSNELSIPSFGRAESLNVAVAAGILLSEFSRRKYANL